MAAGTTYKVKYTETGGERVAATNKRVSGSWAEGDANLEIRTPNSRG